MGAEHVESNQPTKEELLEAQDPDKLLDSKAAAKMLGIKPKTLEGWVARGYGPASVPLGGKIRRWRRAAIVEWVKAQEQTAGQARPTYPGLREDRPRTPQQGERPRAVRGQQRPAKG